MTASAQLFFQRISGGKRSTNVSEARRGASSDGYVALLRILIVLWDDIGCFFVALLKFPPIVQSGSILFRKLDRGGGA